MPKITPIHFYQFLKCPAWVWLDAYGDPEKRRLIHPLVRKLWRQGLLHDSRLIPNQEFVTVEAEDIDEAAAETLHLMRQGRRTIYRGAITHGEWVARPDILERVEGRSDFGNYYYVACDIKRVRELEDVHKFQAAFYAMILERVAGVRPLQGYVLTPEGRLLSFLIEEVLEKFHLTLAEIEKILRGGVPPPFLGSGCRESPWIQECISRVLACDDISLIAHIRSEEREAVIRAGFANLTEFAKADPQEAADKVRGISAKRMEQLWRQAKSLIDKKPVLLEPAAFPEAACELYIDIETDPLRDAEYLFGVLKVEGDKSEYFPFFADTPEEERGAWMAFVNFLGSNCGAPIYHYGRYEIQVIQRLAEKYGHALEHFEHTVDIGKLAVQNAVFPVYFYSLKDIAKVLGFEWRHKSASGLSSIFWYHKWIETGNRKVRQDIIDYNEDDVRATWLVKTWLAGSSARDVRKDALADADRK